MATNDEWLRAAMADDKMVAELLLRLNQSDPHPSAFARQAGAAVAVLLASFPPFDWGTRQPRSKAAAASASGAVSLPGKKDRERTRRSPTTPLSWSACGVGSGCGASPSDGYEDSSRPSDRFVSAVRSKGSAANETTTSATGSKRPRRKKTFSELKDEESSLLKERSHLKKELDSLRIKLEDQRSLNENLKRIKLDLHAQSELKSVPTLNGLEQHEDQNQHRQMEASTSGSAPWDSHKEAKSEHVSDSHGSCPAQYEAKKPSFVLPDLNMMPDEDCTPGGKAVAMS